MVITAFLHQPQAVSICYEIILNITEIYIYSLSQSNQPHATVFCVILNDTVLTPA